MPTTVDKFTSPCWERLKRDLRIEHAIIFFYDLVRFHEKYKRWFEGNNGWPTGVSINWITSPIKSITFKHPRIFLSKSILTLERNYAIGFSKLLPMSQTNIQVLRNSRSVHNTFITSPPLANRFNPFLKIFSSINNFGIRACLGLLARIRGF